MSHRSEVETFALRAAREYATARGLKLVAAFEDTLSGDVARMQVLRRVRRSFPKVPRGAHYPSEVLGGFLAAYLPGWLR